MEVKKKKKKEHRDLDKGIGGSGRGMEKPRR